MKRHLPLIIPVSLVSIFIVAPSAFAAFSDVSEGHEHYAAISWLEERDVISGYEDGTFKPDQEVNRAEALKIILLGSGVAVDESSTGSDLFPDVMSDQWFYPYVSKALEMEWVEGYDDGYFKPEQTINLAETLKIISLVWEIEAPAPTVAPYPDVALDAWYAVYADYAKQHNFIEAQDDGYLHADTAMTRGDLAEIIYRFDYTDENELNTFDLSTNWPESEHSTDGYAYKVPFGWEKLWTNTGEVILWHRDDENGQTGWERTYDNSAVVTISVDENPEGLESSAYFTEVELELDANYGASIVRGMAGAENYAALIMEYSGDYEEMRDIYLALPNDQFVVVQSTYGTGLLSDQLKDYVMEIQESIRYVEVDDSTPKVTVEDVLAEANGNIQVDGQGQATLDLFSDEELIETDAIGVGTGPVDYYYSAWADVTLKYERSFDVILDIEEGQTTAF